MATKLKPAGDDAEPKRSNGTGLPKGAWREPGGTIRIPKPKDAGRWYISGYVPNENPDFEAMARAVFDLVLQLEAQGKLDELMKPKKKRRTKRKKKD